MKKIRRVIVWLTMAVTAAAIVDQLRKPSAQRTWYGEVLGIPYDFRPPTLDRIQSRWWNPEDPRLFTPRSFGVGWDINLYRLIQLIRAQSARA